MSWRYCGTDPWTPACCSDDEMALPEVFGRVCGLMTVSNDSGKYNYKGERDTNLS